jgi:predicted CoA-binding protein
MKHMDRTEALVARLLKRTRTVAVIGASPRTARHSSEVVRYLHHAGYDVIPVRLDRSPVGDLPTYAHLADFGGQVDLVVIFRRPDAGIAHVREAVGKHAEAVWFPPGAWSHEAENEAHAHELTVIKERCIVEDHRHLFDADGEPRSGHPQKTGVHIRRRKPMFEDNRTRPDDEGYVAAGGGGRSAGGGVRSVLDEKKMTKGRPSPRSGPFKHKPG